VVFDATTFKLRYAEFAAVSDALLQLYFNEACLYLDNTETSRITDLPTRTLFLSMITAHIAALNGQGTGGTGIPGAVGRVSSASEGSVSISTDFMASSNGLMAWYLQTQYGVAFWASSARYRTMQYVPYQPVSDYQRRLWQ
jgi:hypothetical protein